MDIPVTTAVRFKILVVRIPMRFQRKGGRKRIFAPDGRELAPATKLQPNGTLAKALARAHRWQRMLDEGRFASVRELAEAEQVGHAYVGRILRLTLLAPDIVERILDGCPAQQVAELMRPFPSRGSGSGPGSAELNSKLTGARERCAD